MVDKFVPPIGSDGRIKVPDPNDPRRYSIPNSSRDYDIDGKGTLGRSGNRINKTEKEKGMGFFDEMEKKGVNISPEQKKTIEDRFLKALQYEPVIGFFGKTGVGKSSLCNALFGEKICEISDYRACTRDAKKVLLDIGGKGLTLMDVPGVGETNERDKEYAELYAKLLPEIDMCLWVLKADDRAISTDEKFYEDIVKPHIEQGKKFFFVLNQADKIEPTEEWDVEGHKPGVNQASNIGLRKADVAQIFKHPETQIIAVSAKKKFNLVNLVDTIVFELPGIKRVTLYHKVPKENRSDEQEILAHKGLADEIRRIIQEELGNRAVELAEPYMHEDSFFQKATKFIRHIPVIGEPIAAGMELLGDLLGL